MAPNLTPGVFKIVSLVEDNPATSVNLILPAWQSVYLNGPITTWRIKEHGDNAYRLSLGGYPFTGVLGDKVTATIHPKQNTEWIATYIEHQDAYTISPIDDESKGWTVADGSHNAKVVLRVIRIGLSHPPFYLHGQLFRFVPADE